jgi:hypothetical protein
MIEWLYVNVGAIYLLAFLAAAVVLIRYRRRSRKATRLGLTAVVGYAVWFVLDNHIVDIRLKLAARWISPDTKEVIFDTWELIQSVWNSTCTLLLFLAVVADRQSKSGCIMSQAEADYG